MSYAALATDRFDEVARFYGEVLGFPAVEEWDRPNGRGRRFDLGGSRLEILDNARKPTPLKLAEGGDRFNVVVEVDDIEEARNRIATEVPPAEATSWGAILFQLRDPDGVPVTFLQWDETGKSNGNQIKGRVSSGQGRGTHFTQLDWARRQFIDKLGIDPFPGTLNLTAVDAGSGSAWGRLKATPGIHIDNPGNGPHDCDARCFPVSIEGLGEAAIVYPEVREYAPDQVEVIAAAGIRSTLGIEDGDTLRLEIKTNPNKAKGDERPGNDPRPKELIPTPPLNTQAP